MDTPAKGRESCCGARTNSANRLSRHRFYPREARAPKTPKNATPGESQAFRAPPAPDREAGHAAREPFYEPLINSKMVAELPLAGLSFVRSSATLTNQECHAADSQRRLKCKRDTPCDLTRFSPSQMNHGKVFLSGVRELLLDEDGVA
jgi:hypothetical protein